MWCRVIPADDSGWRGKGACDCDPRLYGFELNEQQAELVK